MTKNEVNLHSVGCSSLCFKGGVMLTLALKLRSFFVFNCTGAMDMDKFREEMVKEADNATKKNKSEFARGYGGKSGLESEQKDQTTDDRK